MYVLDYLIYHLRPYGIVSQAQPLPEKLSLVDVVGDSAENVKSNANPNTNDNANNQVLDEEAAVSEID